MQKRSLRSGFTTGTCGAAAAKAAAVYLLAGEIRQTIEILTPKGVTARMQVERVIGPTCCFRVQKDSGDDPDVTNQSWIYASAEVLGNDRNEQWYQSNEYPKLYLTGGEGIGVVTRPGLACPVGRHAINPVPRSMIFEGVETICEEMDYRGCLLIRIWIPEGVFLAEKTFNPRLGIEGGISVLGTSGIVEPMSEDALMASIRLEIHMKAVEGCGVLVIAPGNYGEACLREQLHISLDKAVKCSNFVADTIEMAELEGIKKVLFVGHLGKLIKVAGGVKNTHSKYGDRRMEILADCLTAVTGGNGSEVSQKIRNLHTQVLQSNTTEEALEHLTEFSDWKPGRGTLVDLVMEEVLKRICGFLTLWSHDRVQVETVVFSSVYGILLKSRRAQDLIMQLTLEDI